MHRTRRAAPRACLTACLCLAGAFSTATPLRADEPLHRRIDRLIAAGTPDYAAKAAPLADDEEFFRRVHLDLAGMIPTAAETRAFLDDAAPDKRARLIDRLLDGDRFARHMTQVFDALLIERRRDPHVTAADWERYLYESFAANKPYDELVRELLAADGADPKARGAAKFYLARLGEPNDITKDVSRLFLGMNLQCAQCHDHPLVESYKQDFYYGIFAFYNRSFLHTDKAKKVSFLAEKAVGEVSFQSVFEPKVTKQTGPRLPEGPAVKEPELPKGKEYAVAPDKANPGTPKFSRRAQLPGLLASADNERFRRAAANRLWALLLGRGLVHPVDFDHPANPPSHPELLELLADELAALKFDVKAFLRQIALSETYQRSSRMPEGKELPPEQSFGVAPLRPLSAEQLAWSLMQATGLVETTKAALGKTAKEAALNAKLNGNVTPFVVAFGGQAGDPADLGFQATLDQTLFLRNGTLIRGWLTPRTGTLTHRLAQAKGDDALAEELFLSVLTRRPTAEERQDVARFLADNAAARDAALQELVWALLTASEFRFNH